MIQSGGDLYVSGTNGGKPWKLGIADPRGAHEPFATLQIGDGTFSTSGDYERFFMKDGKRYHHLIDPDFGEPASGCRSVTIVTNRAVIADVLSTGVFIMGPDEGMALIEKLPDVEGVIVTSDNEVLDLERIEGTPRSCSTADQRAVDRPVYTHDDVTITLDLVQTVAFAGIILFLGYGLRRLIPALSRVNIPAPVCGGLPVAGLFAILY